MKTLKVFVAMFFIAMLASCESPADEIQAEVKQESQSINPKNIRESGENKIASIQYSYYSQWLSQWWHSTKSKSYAVNSGKAVNLIIVNNGNTQPVTVIYPGGATTVSAGGVKTINIPSASGNTFTVTLGGFYTNVGVTVGNQVN